MRATKLMPPKKKKLSQSVKIFDESLKLNPYSKLNKDTMAKNAEIGKTSP